MFNVKITSVAGNSVVVGKTWFKKNQKDASKYQKACIKCSNHVYGFNNWRTADGKVVIVCLTCGFLHDKAPAVKVTDVKRKVKSKKLDVAIKKKVAPVKKPEVTVKKQVKTQKTDAKPAKESKPAVDTKAIDISEIKGIGKATAEQLRLAGINTAADMLALDSKAIATKIGRKSDTMVKKWLMNLNEML